jgi:hypothetical protein
MPLQDRIGHLQAEDVLVREDTRFPDTIGVSTSLEWRVLEAIRPTQIGLADSSNRRAGSFSSFHPSSEPTFRLGRTSALARAIRKILAKADLAGLNTVEIASVTIKELLGIQFACIEARLRHIQKGLVLTPEKQGTKPPPCRTLLTDAKTLEFFSSR